MVIVETKAFTARIASLLDEEEYRELQLQLVDRPGVGKVIQGTGGLRKIRWAKAGSGKRGGIRIIYLWHPATSTILMLLAYSKNERDDLSAEQRRALQRIVDLEYP